MELKRKFRAMFSSLDFDSNNTMDSFIEVQELQQVLPRLQLQINLISSLMYAVAKAATQTWIARIIWHSAQSVFCLGLVIPNYARDSECPL